MIAEIKNPKNLSESCQVILHYETILHTPYRSHTSNGDIGNPNEYIERLTDWECVGKQPEWLSDWVVRLQVDTIL